MKTAFSLMFFSLWICSASEALALTYPVVDTAQIRCYDDQREIEYPHSGRFFGQDAQYQGLPPTYNIHPDGTATDVQTGLMWTRDPGEKMTADEAAQAAAACRTGGHDDWRLPTIKELYSLMLFSGSDPDMRGGQGEPTPFLNTEVFTFRYGSESQGDRLIDSQFATSTRYTSTTMNGNPTMFGVNFADGRIKGYPIGKVGPRGEKKYYALFVRGNPLYGQNDFQDNGDGTITDLATGLTWQKADSGKGMNWEMALAYAENQSSAGHDDWRLPNAKELQSIVDYSRSPDHTGTPALSPLFSASSIVNEAGQTDYPNYWTGTTHVSSDGSGRAAVYLSFGRGMGNMRGEWTDVHGAGAQRSDPKSGSPNRFTQGRGPQGDAIRIQNFVRCVRGGMTTRITKGPAVERPGNAMAKQPPAPRNEQNGRPEQGPDDRQGIPGPEEFISRLDSNGDGQISLEEFDGPKHHFASFDKNHDGFVSLEEVPPPPPQKQPPERR